MHVVAAVVRNANSVFAARRAAHKSAGGKWEFPGGKVEGSENPIAALVREIREELNVEIAVIQSFDRTTTRVGDILIDLDTYLCDFVGAEPSSSLDHDRFAWLEISDLLDYDFAEPDLPAVKKLMRGQDDG
jgi:8-oxo-dGTP diphosphatase